jgi:hypothetical protein
MIKRRRKKGLFLYKIFDNKYYNYLISDRCLLEKMVDPNIVRCLSVIKLDRQYKQ